MMIKAPKHPCAVAPPGGAIAVFIDEVNMEKLTDRSVLKKIKKF